MEIDVRLGPVEANDALDVFNETAAPLIKEHLYTESVLDPQGIDRVMAQMRPLFLQSYRHTILVGNCGVDGKPSPLAKEELRSIIDAFAQPTAKAVFNAKMAALYVMANALALIDLKLHKRRIH